LTQTPSSESRKLIKLKIIQEQAGHEHASTTALYTCVSSDFRTRALRRALDVTAAAAMRPGRSR
jgi:integrase/recombinase XerC